MSLSHKIRGLSRIAHVLLTQPGTSTRMLKSLPEMVRSTRYAAAWQNHARQLPAAAPANMAGQPANPLQRYFDAHQTGRGIWKWNHYFDIYHRHLQKFIGREVHIVEVGIYSGGSLNMWREYFGPQCRVYGVDIEPACRSYENDWTRVFIGDQADPAFWQSFKQQVPAVDILIDDGGHQPEQQIATLEEMLPHLRPGGVFLCEDIHKADNRFAPYAQRLAGHLNTYDKAKSDPPTVRCTEFQRSIHSVHLYPYVTVVEKREQALAELIAPRHGTEWQPFLGTHRGANQDFRPAKSAASTARAEKLP